MRKSRLISIVTLVFLVSIVFATLPSLHAQQAAPNGDWSMFFHDPAHTGYTSSPGPTTSNILWSFNGTGNVEASPAVSGGFIYVASTYGNMYCLNATTGKQIWVNFKIQGGISSSPAVAYGKVYVGAGDGRVYCLDAKTGSQLWNYTTGGFTRSSPTVVNGRVYIGSSDGNLYCLDASTGTRIWSYTTGSPGIETTTVFTSGLSSPAVAGGYVYVGGSAFHCINASSGVQVWSFPISVRLSPAVSGGYVYAIADNGTLYCLNAATGNEAWGVVVVDFRTNASVGINSPAVAHGFVYLGGDGVFCLNASTGEIVWHVMNGLVDIYPFGAESVAGNYVYVCTTLDVYTYCLDAYTGSVVWRSTTVGSENPPAIANGVLYEGGYNVTAFGASTIQSFSPPPSSAQLTLPLSILQIIAIAAIVGGATAVAAFLIYDSKRKQLPSGSQLSSKFKRRFLSTVTAVFIVIILMASAAVIYESGFIQTQSSSSPPSTNPLPSFTVAPNLPNPLWQHNIGHQAVGCAADGGRVFAIDIFGEVHGFNAENGESIWNVSIGEYEYHAVVAGNGSLYAASTHNLVKLNESNGQTEASLAQLQSINFGSQSALFNFLSSGQQIFVSDNTRINPDNGTLMWQVNGSSSNPPLVSQDRVILWNYDVNGSFIHGNGHVILCVNETSGATLWSFDPGTPVFEPTVAKDILLFGTSNGDFYAVNLTNGKQEWKTHVDLQNLISGENLPANSKYLSAPTASQVQIDLQTGAAIWAFSVTQSGINGLEGNDLYIAVVTSLNLSNGDILWSNQVVRPIQANNGATPPTPLLSLAAAENTVFLATGNDFWAFNASSGSLQGTHHFDYGVNMLVSGDGIVFLIEDVYLMAYN